MSVRKKSKETLEQQKSSFLSFAGTQKKYEPIIAELFLMDNEKIGDINYVKSYLKWKWIDEVLVDNFEDDYKKYLKNRYFYWPINQYPPELQSRIIKNNRILEKLKKEIVEDYRKINDFDLIVSDKKFKEFLIDEIWCEEFTFNSNNIDDDISDIEKKIKEKQDALDSKKELLEHKEKEYAKSNFILFIKKNKLKNEISSLNNDITEIDSELSRLCKEKDELHYVRIFLNLIKSKRSYYDLLTEFIWFKYWEKVFNVDFDFSKTGKNNYKEYCKNYLSKIKSKLKICSCYMSYDDFIECVVWPLSWNRKSYKEYEIINEYINSLKNKINEYLNYFFFGEDNWFDCIRECWNYTIPSVFSWEKIDGDILSIILDFNDNFSFEWIDEKFIDDLFIHKSDFRVLDEILKDWCLISHNEIVHRESNNSDIKNSSNDHGLSHKDVYFSRWFNLHWYWKSKRLEDVVFYVNTMRNFALCGYWVPLNSHMQSDHDISDYRRDFSGYSIVSKSSLDPDSYGKVDVKDLFIFVSENLKPTIENSPYYPISNVHIIYIPSEYYTAPEYSYKIYEFMEQQLKQYKQNKKIVPNRIIWSKKNNINSIDSIYSSSEYLWAFCSEIWNDNHKANIPNLLWDWNVDNLLNFLRKCSKPKDVVYLDKIEEWLKNVNFDKLSIPSCIPFELFKLIYLYLKIDSSHRPKIKDIENLLSKSWYSQKEITIYAKITEYLNMIYHGSKPSQYFKPLCDSFNLDYDDTIKIILSQINELLKK